MRTALRIAVWYKHVKICIGTFGLGPGFKNPPGEVAVMWRQLLLDDPEFKGFFSDVVFAFEAPEGVAGSSSTSSSSKGSSRSSKSSSSKSSSLGKNTFREDLEIFKQTFSPSVIHGI